MVSRIPKIMLIQFVQTNQSDRGVTDLLPYSLKSQINTRVLFAKKKKKKADDFHKWLRKKSGGKAFSFHKQLTGMALAWFPVGLTFLNDNTI